MPQKSNKKTRSIYILKITLKQSKPPIWRRVQVHSDITLNRLHKIIQSLFDWDNSHLHAFEVDGRQFSHAAFPLNDAFNNDGNDDEDSQKVRLDEVAAPGSSFTYCYDFGDNWEHVIKVEKALDFQKDIPTPYCLKGKFAAPPEDSGGIWGYSDMLERLANPDDEERDELLQWLGEDFDPQHFDLKEINQKLERLK